MLHRFPAVLPVLIMAAALTASLWADDWPQWGGRLDRNFASHEKGLPDLFEPGKRRNASAPEIDMATTRNVRWTALLGTQTYGNMTVSGGKVFIGTNSAALADPNQKKSRGGAVLCFDEKTGKRLWELHVPRFQTDLRNFNFDDLSLGICSSPTVEGDRVYLVGNRCELLCLDVSGMANGNDGPFKEEAQFIAGLGAAPAKVDATCGDILWMYDMIHEPAIDVWVQDAADCSPVILGDNLYLSPSNGVDRSHKNIPKPDAPMLVVFDKKTGRYLARDDAFIGTKFFHGAWSSPSAGVVNDRPLVFFGGPDGICYAFDPTIVPAQGSLPPGAKLPEAAKDVGLIKRVWWFDCNPPERRFGKDGKPLPYRAKVGGVGDGPSEIIATPVFYKNRVYVCVGQDPRHGTGRGNLVCIDASGQGDVTKTHQVWAYDKIDRSLSTVSIYDGLLYVADFAGIVHCLDAETGKAYWTFDTKARIWSSTFAADGKVWLGTEKGELFVFAADKERKLIGKLDLGDKIYTTPIVANKTLYVTTQSRLWAVRRDGR